MRQSKNSKKWKKSARFFFVDGKRKISCEHLQHYFDAEVLKIHSFIKCTEKK